MNLSRSFRDFPESEKAGGFLLIFCTLISLLIANSSFGDTYTRMWNISVGGLSIGYWINDGLMSIFFLLIGLELEREIYVGELANLKNALLPIVSALGGMLLPAGLFLIFNHGKPSQTGAGIPMATDIAFAIAILSLLGSRVPFSLKVLLTAIAVIDDLGAILVIAVFYTSTISWINLAIALGIFLSLILLNRFKVETILPYFLGGIVMWFFMLRSGIHPTIAGVLLAFTVPFRGEEKKSPSLKIHHFLHKPVAYFILPLFALANTCVVFNSHWLVDLHQLNSIGILSGLVVGKPVGIFLFGFVAVSLGFCKLPGEIKWTQMIGIGMLGGIGFTMSIFITLLAFGDADAVNQSKIAVLIGSLTSAVLGFTLLKITLTSRVAN